MVLVGSAQSGDEFGSVIGEGRDGWQPLPSCIPRADSPEAAVGEVGETFCGMPFSVRLNVFLAADSAELFWFSSMSRLVRCEAAAVKMPRQAHRLPLVRNILPSCLDEFRNA
jgi:hypothetical protein